MRSAGIQSGKVCCEPRRETHHVSFLFRKRVPPFFCRSVSATFCGLGSFFKLRAPSTFARRYKPRTQLVVKRECEDTDRCATQRLPVTSHLLSPSSHPAHLRCLGRVDKMFVILFAFACQPRLKSKTEHSPRRSDISSNADTCVSQLAPIGGQSGLRCARRVLRRRPAHLA